MPTISFKLIEVCVSTQVLGLLQSNWVSVACV